MNTVSNVLAKQWKALHSELSLGRENKSPLAGLFLGYKPDGFDSQINRILFVGKATGGDFDGKDIHERSFNGKSAFWNFARKLSHSTGCNDDGLINVAWSNVSKIGVVDGNPSPSLQLSQAALASKTLREEIRSCRPGLVVFVCDGYEDEVVYESVGAHRGGMNDFETRQSIHGEYYVRGAVQEGGEQLPPMLWLRHPQGKSKDCCSQWLEEAKKLVA